ncbi:MAG TPA: hypothetical protein VKB78_04225 [Pirellulales bacterium]|nr:hypothetical protein [Pirellulales bacterium]
MILRIEEWVMCLSIFLRRAPAACIAGLAVAVLCLCGTQASGAPDPSAAMKTLADKGLTKLKPANGIVSWVVDDDAKVHQKLETLRKAAAAEREAAKKVKTDSVSVAKDRETLSKAEKHYQEIKPFTEKPETIPPNIAKRFRNRQAMIDALVSDVNATVATINRLQPRVNGKFVGGMAPALIATIADWMKARNDLIVAYLAAEPLFNELNEKYTALQNDAEVAAALQKLGKNNHLGSKEFEQDRTLMAAAEKTTFSEEIPFYRDGLLVSIGGLLNENTTVAVAVDSTNPKAGNWAPASELTKAGVQVDPMPSATLTMTGNGKRVIQCRRAIVPKLRFGKVVLENLSFLALPDDAKDLGIQISSKELRGFDMTPDVEKWLFKLVKKQTPKSDEDKTETTESDKSKPGADIKAGTDASQGDNSDNTEKSGKPAAVQPDQPGKSAGDKDAKR